MISPNISGFKEAITCIYKQYEIQTTAYIGYSLITLLSNKFFIEICLLMYLEIIYTFPYVNIIDEIFCFSFVDVSRSCLSFSSLFNIRLNI